MSTRRSLMVAAMALLAVVAGCRESGSGTSSYLVRPGTARIRVAVVPFEAASPQFEAATQAVTQEVVTMLLGTGLFDVVEPGVVYQAMSQAGARNLYGLDASTMQTLQQQIGNVRLFVVGLVQESGDVRIGPESYPSITISARVLDAQTSSILWAGSSTRTGADTEKLFGIGAVHSTGRVTRAAVRDLIGKIDSRQLAQILNAAVVPAGPTPVAPTAPSGEAKPTGKERYFDERATWTQAGLTELMVEVEGLTRGAVTYRQHHFDIVETTYQGQGAPIRVKLADYRQAKAARDYVALDHAGEKEQTFSGLPSYSGESSADDPGAFVLDVAAGRFGLHVQGPSAGRADIEKVATAILKAMK